MTTFLLLLTLILNMATIFAIIVLYLRQNRLVETERKQEKIISEIDEIFSAYLLEWKEENDKFLKLITNANMPVNQGKADKPAEKTDIGSQKDPEAVIREIQQPHTRKGISYHAARQAYQAGVPIKHSEIEGVTAGSEETKEVSLMDQVTTMKQQGLTIEEIARKLNKGKTEIELLLKFRPNRQE
ncbi:MULTISPECIES: hypothetical protein [Mesobacillus]|uniref:Swarming motility protein SwrB n=2 Tax=Mesobacillus TaxID=2675231 RepID=A0A0D6ZA94_9BACI|nr:MULTISPECIES: hypothetical protein [Mesobacillus]KIY21513.1 hypothetical protein UB32_13295 [Mesobacillus subterraneus]MDQ0412478.1 hypothetical protein [Mesobacillus stamsii]